MAITPTLPVSIRSTTMRSMQSNASTLAGLWHLTSLDAATVAIVWCLGFAWSARVDLPLWLPIVLGLFTWTFYVADRLVDAGTAKSPLRRRHLFHWHHRRVFIPLAAVAATVAVVLVMRSMPLAARTRNSALAFATLAYFGSVHSPWRIPQFKWKIPKELLVGIIFTLACAVPAWARTSIDRTQLIPVVLCFTAIAWLNCYAIEIWESSTDARRFSVSIYGWALCVASLAAACGMILLSHGQLWRLAALLLAGSVSAALLSILDNARLRLSPTALRAAADLVLLTPLVLLLH